MSQTDDRADLECWCCATPYPVDALIHLGNHPEVTVCRQCAHFLHKQAEGLEDAERTGFGPRSRDRLRSVRRTVVDRGWHRQPVIGRALRRLGRYTP
jgi:hypothetical protein